MPATALTVTQLTHKTPVTVPASPGAAADNTNGNAIPNGGNVLLVMNNTAGSSGTVTVATSEKVDGDLATTGRQFTVPANTIQYVRLGSPSVYGTTTTVTASASTIKLAAFAV